MQTGGVCPAAARSWMLEWTVDAREEASFVVVAAFCSDLCIAREEYDMRMRQWSPPAENMPPCVSNSVKCLDRRHIPTCLFALLEEHIFRPHLFRLNHFLFN